MWRDAQNRLIASDFQLMAHKPAGPGTLCVRLVLRMAIAATFAALP